MFTQLLLVFILLPLADLVLIWMLLNVDVGLTFLWILLSGVIGAWYVRRQGTEVLAEIRASVNDNKIPTDILIEGALVVLAGGLLITPGLLTDIFGFSMLVKPCRRWYRIKFLSWLKKKVTVKTWTTGQPFPQSDNVIDAEVVKRNEADRPGDHSPDKPGPAIESSEISS